jgi:hypothetical protein
VVTEEVERVDLVETIRPAGKVDFADEGIREVALAAVRVVDEDYERLQKEERHDGEVVAEQPPGREPQQESDQGGRDDHDRDRDLGLQVVPGVAAGHDPVEVGAEAEEGHVAEVEQPREADDDVQAQREQGVDERDQAITKEVPFVRDEAEDHERPQQDGQMTRGRYALPNASDGARKACVGLAALLDLRDPLVDSDLRPVDRVRPLGRSGREATAGLFAVRRTHTFWSAGDPSSPLGRIRNMPIRSAKTYRFA